MLRVVTMLTYVISLELQLSSRIIIYNQCTKVELVSPVHFSKGAVCPKISGQQIDIGAKMNVIYEINVIQDEFEGALLYKLQRYSDSQYNTGTSTAEANKNEIKFIQMFVAWKMKDSVHFARVALIGHNKDFTWNEDELRKLYDKNHSRLKEYDYILSDTWHMDNNMTLKTSFKVRNMKGKFELNISISEEEKDDYAIRPLCVDLER
jgi:hypothetical protein